MKKILFKWKKISNFFYKEDTKLIIFTDGAKTNGEEFLNGISSINNKVIVSVEWRR
ncbi:MAG: hypothetical protein R2837_06285 [Aliarcobacter sp.]